MIAFGLWTLEELYKTNKTLFLLFLSSYFVAALLIISLIYKKGVFSLLLFSYWALVMLLVAFRKKRKN
ncbi:hypothetical protein HZC31_08220 [Candidatus Woesearchaeota archaeon]|nr:hypothetical protein [Candidatus Woesearchaeota archaeon]